MTHSPIAPDRIDDTKMRLCRRGSSAVALSNGAVRMRISHSLVLAFSMFLAIAMAAVAQETEEQPKPVRIDVYYRQDSWIMAPDVADEPSSEDSGITQSVFLSVIRAVNPATGEPYDKSEPNFNFALDDLRHFFRLEKKEFLLGEPILVEHRIELNGPGEWNWFVGGNYRARGRDDNFSFVLRRADGALVPDVYPKLEGLIFGGGLGSDHTIKKAQPLSYWLGLQKYSAITEPGSYDLYCMTGYKRKIFGEVEAMRPALPDEIALDHFVSDSGELVDRETGERSRRYALVTKAHYLDSGAQSPLKGVIPSEVLAYATEQSFGFPSKDAGSFGTVARFRIGIRKGTPAERQQMVAQWTKAAESTRNSVIERYNQALIESVWYARQDHFLPLLERWITNFKEQDHGFDSVRLDLNGLALRPDSSAFALLLKASPAQVTNAFYRLHPNRIAEAIPVCIDWLTHGDNDVRARAESRLIDWTGQSFEHTWKGYHYQRPTLAEGQSMQRLWRAWWRENSSSFKPHKPCSFPCENTKKAPQ